MNGMIFKNILICDILKQKARFLKFSKGINVVTSTENHVGKSSLLKSLYYTMGAEVGFDTVWDKNTKLCIVDVNVSGKDYTIARYQRNFSIFSGDQLLLLTKSVTKDLAKKYEEILNFSVYLPNKKDKKVELAPPVFSFMPYYIDQDTGWTELYKSFASIDQYEKADREKSLYYHMNIYNRKTIELFGKRDILKDKIDELKRQHDKIRITIEALSKEVSNLLPAETIDELELNLEIPKDNISQLVKEMGEVRDKIQMLETTLQQHERQLNIINEYNKIKDNSYTNEVPIIHECPRCGYSFDEELHDMVRKHYNLSNEEYMCKQIQLIIDSINEELDTYKNKYIELMKKLEEQEKTFDDTQDAYDLYVKQRGLQKSISNFTDQLSKNILEQSKCEEEIKKISNELKKLPNKKEIEKQYIGFVKQNIIKLGAWNAAYDGKIKLIKPLKAQGTLESKIILSQVIGLFQTMEYFKSEVIRFPFVIDSPRAKEASQTSSNDILKLIFELNSMPQIILATMDFKDFQSNMQRRSRVINLKEKEALLNSKDYKKNSLKIREMYELLNNIK